VEARRYFGALVTEAIAISSFDRQTLPIAVSSIERTIQLSNRQFRFLVAGTFHIIGFLAILLLGGTVQPLKTPDLLSKASLS
jgi:MFS transporter, ACS family, hexuronate transporter